MDSIIWIYIFSILIIVIFIWNLYSKPNPTKIKESLVSNDKSCPTCPNGTTRGQELTHITDKDDTCEYILQVNGLICPVCYPEDLDILIAKVPLDFTRPIIDVINKDIINTINTIIIFFQYIANYFIGCLFPFYFLNGIGSFMFKITTIIFGIFGMEHLPLNCYDWMDENLDTPLHNYCGLHFMHFPDIITNRCYFIDGKDRIKCWKSPIQNTGNEGMNGFPTNASKNYAFLAYLIICIAAWFIIVIVGGFLSKFLSTFAPSVQCKDSKACKPNWMGSIFGYTW